MRVYAAVAEDQYGNRFPVAVLGVNENAPLIDARAAADNWSLQILPLLDSHVYRIRHSITECGGSHEDFQNRHRILHRDTVHAPQYRHRGVPR